MNFAPGKQFGQWTLQRLIGRGGNGFVWLAINTEGKSAAIKFLKKDHLGGQREIRFRDEIRFLTKEVERSGILPLIDSHVPNLCTQEDGPWFSTPVATCFTDLDFRGSEKLPELIRRIEAVAQTLQKLHAENKWHRDLKPENLFLLGDDPVIGDFGLVDFPDKEENTKESEAVGSRNYTAPELESGAAHSPADKADVYSLAKTLWVLASGEPVPQGTLRIEEPKLQFSKRCPNPRAQLLDSLLEKATNHDPVERPTMQEFAKQLGAWLKQPVTDPLKIDLAALKGECQSVFEIERRVKFHRDKLIDASKSVLLSFESVLEQIAGHIKECTGIAAFVGQAYWLERHQFNELYGGVRLISRNAREVRVTIGEDGAAFLQSFAQVEALSDDTMRIVIGYLSETTVHGNRLVGARPIWIKEVIAPRQSPELDNELKICRVELLNYLGLAISAFTKCVQGITE